MLLAVAAATGLSGCAGEPKSPEEEAARRAATMRLSTTQCTIYMGGVSGMKEVLAAANRKESEARHLGANDAMIQQAKADVEMTWNTGVAMIGQQEMCSNIMAAIANDLVEQS